MRHRVIVKEVTRGFESDDSGETGNELSRRGRLFADGWIDDETVLRTGIPIAKNVARDFYVGERTVEWMDRAWADGNESSGLIIVENELGSPTPITYSFGPDALQAMEEGKHFWDAEESDFLIVKWVVITTNEDAEFSLWDNGATDGDQIGTSLVVSTAHAVINDAFREESDLLLYRLERGHALSVQCDDEGTPGAPEAATVKVIMREIVGT